MINYFSKNADNVKSNPVFKSAAPMKLYPIDMVNEIEKTEESGDKKEKSESRFPVMKNIAENKNKDPLKQIDNMSFNVKLVESNRLYKNSTVRYY